MQFKRRQFLGFELDILVGHPGYALLFVATQVARAAGLKSPNTTIGDLRKSTKDRPGRALSALVEPNSISLPVDSLGRALRSTTVMFSEEETYLMLLRGQAPQSEPFRKWVTGEVLPSIRKTGTYTMPATQEQQPALPAPAETAQLYARIDRLESKVDELLELVRGLDRRPTAPALPQPPSPYEKTTAVILPDEVDRRQLLEIGEMCITRPAMEKLTGHVLLALEHQLDRMWKAEGGVALETYVSQEKGRKWTKWPKSWLAQKLKRQLYQQTIRQVISEYLTR